MGQNKNFFHFFRKSYVILGSTGTILACGKCGMTYNDKHDRIFYINIFGEEMDDFRPNTLIETVILSVILFMRDVQILAERCLSSRHENRIIKDLIAFYGIFYFSYVIIFRKSIRKYLRIVTNTYFISCIYTYIDYGR